MANISVSRNLQALYFYYYSLKLLAFKCKFKNKSYYKTERLWLLKFDIDNNLSETLNYSLKCATVPTFTAFNDSFDVQVSNCTITLVGHLARKDGRLNNLFANRALFVSK